MKKHFLHLPYMALCTLFVLFTFSSCEKAFPEHINFDLDEVSYTFTLQPADTTGNLTVSTDKLNIDMDSAMAAQNIDNYEVTSVKINSANLVTTTPDANFNSFESLGAYIMTQNHPETKLGENNAIADGLQTVELDVNKNINLVEYVKDKPTTFIIKGNVTDPLTNAMTVTVKMNYSVEVSKK
jgi:hypothetical protein